MGSIGLGLGLLLFFLIDELNADNQEEVADTVVARVLDHLGVANDTSPRWQEEE